MKTSLQIKSANTHPMGFKHTSHILYAIFFLLTLGVGNAWGDVETYTFTSKSWAATNSANDNANWTSGKDGNQFQNNRGIQVTTGASGANGISPISFSNVSQVEVTYSTNASKGAGSISVKVGDNDAHSQDVTTSGGTSDRTLTYSIPSESGIISLEVTCTTNSIYIKSVSITYDDGQGGNPNLSSVTISGTPTKTAYSAGDAFDPTGLTVTANYDNSTTQGVTADSWTACKIQNGTYVALDNAAVALAADETGIYVKATFNEVTSTAFHVTGLKVNAVEESAYTLTALADIAEGDELIIVGNNGSNYAMSNDKGTGNPPVATAVSIVNDAITNPANTIIWTLTKSNNTYTFYPKGSTTTWLYCTDANNGVRVGTTTSNNAFVLDNSGYLKSSTLTRYVGIYSSQDWRCYGASDATNIAGQSFAFYVKPSTTPKVNISGTLNAFSYMRDNGPSAAQSFKVSGSKLTANLVVTAPDNYEVCETENGTYTASVEFTPSNGTVAETDVYIRLQSGLSIANNYNGDITVSSTGATNATKAVSGSVTTPVYTVTLHTNGGTITTGHEVESYTEGVGATLPTADYISKDGSTFNGWFANEGLTGSAVTTIATNATGAKEYWAGWTELPGYDVVWYVDGVSYTAGDPTTHVAYNGSISKLPSTPTSLDITSKTFVGWTTAAVTDKQNAAPTPLYTAANEIPGNIQAKQEFYAVFAQETYSGTFTKVTDASTLAAGDRLLINASDYAAGTLGSNNYLSRESVTFTSTTITNKGNAAVWVLGGASGAWTLTSEEGTLKCTGTSNNSLSMSSGVDTWKISISSGNATIENKTHATYIKYNSSGSRFSSYASGQTAVQLYREGTSLTDYTTKFVKPVAVTSVSLNKDETTLAIGGTETLTATVAPANATNKNVSWNSNATSVATVTSAGVVTAVSAGEATITVTTEDGSKTATCTVTVLPTVETPVIGTAAGAIAKNSKVTITCATEGASILYSLDGSDPSLAYPEGGVTISAACTLKAKATKTNYTTSAVAEAAYTIIKASQTVSFTESAYAFRLSSAEYSAFIGQAASSTYDGASISYTSNNTSVATVNASTGAVELQGVKGTATITATAAEDDDYASAFATYTITVLRAGVNRTGDFVLVTNANQLADGDYILLASDGTSSAEVFSGIASSAGTHQSKTVSNVEIAYAQLIAEGNTAKIITLEVIGNYFAFNYGTESDLYIAAGEGTSSASLVSATSTTSNDYALWSIAIGEGNVANVTNQGNSTYGTLSYNTQGNGAFKSYKGLQTGSLRIYKQKDKNKTKQTLTFATPSYEFPLNESAYTSFEHQLVSGANTTVTYTTSNASVADIENNEVVLKGGLGTATITATAAEDDDYDRASATYTITVTAALQTVTFHFYKAADATADQTALKEETSGAGITVPAKPADVGEYTFLGWASATLDETQTAPTNIVAALQAGATYHPTEDVDYYAIYRRLENSDGRFYLMHEVNSTPNYAKAPVGDEFGNTTDITLAAKFVQTEDNKLYYYNGTTPTYIAGTHTGTGSDGRALDFTTNANDALVWTITESGQTVSYYDNNTEKYFAHSNTLWAAYKTTSLTQTNQTKDLTKVYVARVYYTSTPDKMVSPVLTWAHGNEAHEMQIEATYENAAIATVSGEPVSVTYSSSDESKATVDANGVVTAILGGDVTITATVAENPGVSRALVESYEVTITKKVPQITFAEESGYNYKVFVGDAYQKDFSTNVTTVTDGEVTYSLSNNVTSNDNAEINASTGVVKGKASTGSTIQYMYVRTAETDMYQAWQANHIFYVLALKNQPLAFGQASYSFNMNESVEAFTNTLSGAVTTVAYESDNTSVAEVNASTGEVTVHSSVCGVATITATAAEGQVGDDVYKAVSQTYTITVNYPAPTFSAESGNIKAPVALAISGYDENTKLYYADGNEDPATLYSEPIVISETKTIRAKATNADGSLVSPIASVTLTKVVPAVTGEANGGTITLTSNEGSLITYIILNPNGVTVAEGTDVTSPVVFNTELSGTYSVEASAKWDVENGFTSESYENDFVIKGKGHLPINSGDGSGIADEPWATKVGYVGTYNSGNQRIKFDASEQALIAAFVEKPIQLSYQIKHNPSNSNAWSSTTNVFKVQWSANGEDYSDIVVYNSSNPIVATEEDGSMTATFDLDESVRYIKWTYTNKTASIGGNVALGQIRITCEAVVIDGVDVVDIPENYDGDVVVEEDVTWAPSGLPEVNNLTVKQGAVVDLDQAMLIVNDVILESQEGYSGQILEADNFEAQGSAYYDLTLNTTGTMDNSKWYAFAVPFPVDAQTGIQRLSNDGKTSPAGFNSHYVLLKYNSSLRASSGNGWEYITAGETLMPGKFYMIALNSNAYNRVRMTKKAGADLNNSDDLSLSLQSAADPLNANWNAVANNALCYSHFSSDENQSGIKAQIYNSALDSYDASDFDKITFTVGTPFFVQTGVEDILSIAAGAAANETVVKAPARYEMATEEFEIRLGADSESYFDRLYVSASEEALNEYQIGHDLAKAGVSSTVPQMYVPAYGAKLCDAEFPLVNDEATFPLTFTTPTAGTYQLYLAQVAKNAELYLQRDGNIIWNLTTSPYALELNKGTTENYSLLLKAVAETPTDIENTEAINGANGVQKVIIDEHVYILRGEQLFDVTGKVVKK